MKYCLSLSLMKAAMFEEPKLSSDYHGRDEIIRRKPSPLDICSKTQMSCHYIKKLQKMITRKALIFNMKVNIYETSRLNQNFMDNCISQYTKLNR